MKVRVEEVKAATADSARELIQRAVLELGVYGGMSEGTARTDELEVFISFDPSTANGGAAAVLAWLEELGVEFSATFHAF